MFAHLYLVVLALHVGSLAIFGGAIVADDLRALGIGQSWTSLRIPKRIGLAAAIVTGLVLFGVQPLRYLHDAWFWTKLALLGLIALLALREGTKLTAGLSLALWIGVICAGRGPATVKDVMHSMIDPSGDYVFQSVEQVADEQGAHEKAPRTEAEWEDLKARLAVLEQAPQLLQGRTAARMKDRSRNPQSESQPEQVEQALDQDRAAFGRRARQLQSAAAKTLQAADAKDVPGLLKAIDGIDKACENCHLHYWYPNDKRAQQAAREDGVTDN